jgi:hypothetical protein
MSAWSIFLFATILAADEPSIAEGGLELSFLISANESAVGLIHSLHMEIDSWETWRNGKELRKRRHLSTWIYSKQGTLQRQRYVYHGVSKDAQGRAKDSGDLFEDGTVERCLINWNAQRPYALFDRDQGPLQAWYRPQHDTSPTPFPDPGEQFAMLGVQNRIVEPRRSLSEFLAACGGQITVGPAPRAGSWLIKVDSPHTKDGLEHGLGVLEGAEIELDSTVNYMIRRLLFRTSDPQPDNPRSSNLIVEREVLEFLPCENDAFVPKRVRSTMWAPKVLKEPTQRSERDAGMIIVNHDLPDSAFGFAFPENAIVRELPPVDGKTRAFVWGPDNKPAREIHSVSDLLPLPPNLASGNKFVDSIGLIIALFLIGLLVLSVAAISYRSRKRREL